MEQRKIVLLAVVTAVLIAAAVLLSLLLGGGGQTAAVKLPDTWVAPPDESPGAGGGLTLADATPETVQAVISTLARPDSYSRRLAVTNYWEGGSRSYHIGVWVKGGALRLTLDSPGAAEEKHVLYRDGGVSLWYGDGEDGVYQYDSKGEAGAWLPDGLQMLPSYEDVLALETADIQEAGYVEQGGGWRIMVSATDKDTGYLQVYYISVETGLLEAAQRWDGNVLVYSMSASETDLAAPDDAMFQILL